MYSDLIMPLRGASYLVCIYYSLGSLGYTFSYHSYYETKFKRNMKKAMYEKLIKYLLTVLAMEM